MYIFKIVFASIRDSKTAFEFYVKVPMFYTYRIAKMPTE